MGPEARAYLDRVAVDEVAAALRATMSTAP
jgi:hypothetical protein